MSRSTPSSSAGRHLRSSKARVRSIEYRRRAVTATEAAVPGFAGYVGRVGALAVALGGWSNVDGGIVIDVSEMKSVTIDAASGIATVGAGLNQSEAVSALGKSGFAAPTGGEGSVRLAGATSGGGLVLMTRNSGMASDNLLAAEVVVAPSSGGAEVIVADMTTNPDLVWAPRGAGNGGFGIVTSLTYKACVVKDPDR